MGSEDLFHKRKARNNTALQRKKNERSQNNRYLIVCEGTKTEPNYFHDLIEDLHIPHHVVRIAKNNGVSPDRVVAHALDLYKNDAVNGDAYDKVYCVFDRDRHTTFDEAVKCVKSSGKPLVAITSTPCFEVWLLLHFCYTDKPFHAAGKKSMGDQVVAALKTKQGFRSYGKGQKGVYAQLKGMLNNALGYAQQLRNHCAATDSNNPSTDIDKLVLELQNLGR